MPALTNLSSRLRKDPSWRATYSKNLPKSKLVAKEICIVHVSGNPGRVSFADLILTPPYKLPTSESIYGYCSDMTREAEDNLGLKRSLYFYAGRAHPSFGKIALAFDYKCEGGHSGSVTPFDTGGVANKMIATNLSATHPPILRWFTRNSEFSLKQWREAFAHFLAAYFSPLSDYWFGKPFMNDPEELFTRNADWRARVFEVRFHEGQEILTASFWCASRGQKQLLDREAKAHPPIGALSTPLQKLLTDISTLVPIGTPFYCEEVESEIRRRVGL
jgi:hypothetical protein